MQNVVYMSNERNWSIFVVLRRRRFHIRFSLLFVLLFYFFGVVSSVTTTLDKFQFQSQKRLSQINVVVTIRLKFKLYAVFIEWGSRIVFVFVGRQDIVNYWDFPPKFPQSTTKGWYRNLLDNITEICLWRCLLATDWFVLQILLE